MLQNVQGDEGSDDLYDYREIECFMWISSLDHYVITPYFEYALEKNDLTWIIKRRAMKNRVWVE